MPALPDWRGKLADTAKSCFIEAISNDYNIAGLLHLAGQRQHKTGRARSECKKMPNLVIFAYWGVITIGTTFAIYLSNRQPYQGVFHALPKPDITKIKDLHNADYAYGIHFFERNFLQSICC